MLQKPLALFRPPAGHEIEIHDEGAVPRRRHVDLIRRFTSLPAAKHAFEQQRRLGRLGDDGPTRARHQADQRDKQTSGECLRAFVTHFVHQHTSRPEGRQLHPSCLSRPSAAPFEFPSDFRRSERTLWRQRPSVEPEHLYRVVGGALDQHRGAGSIPRQALAPAAGCWSRSPRQRRARQAVDLEQADRR